MAPSSRASSGGASAAKTQGKAGPPKVMFVGHIPHGFFEAELKQYFEQFGKVSKVRVSRSKRTGKSRGYGFLQFQHGEVAAIAAEAMDGYMMFGQTLRCHTMAPADVHAATFRHANRKMRRKPWLEIAAERHNAERTPQQERVREAKLLRKDARRKRRLAELGIDYEYEPLQPSRHAVKTTF